VLKRKIETLLKKWKSEYYIISKLSDTKFDTELIKEILEELNFDNNDIIEKELIKLKNKWLEKQKIIQKMYSKWYSYDDIKYKI
jgi:SOS response regulatory protein OraA/RecX